MYVCRDCDTPITQPAIGRRKVFCAACLARHQAQYQRERIAAYSPEQHKAAAQYRREYRDALSPERRATCGQAARDWYAALSPEALAVRARAERERQLQRKYGLGVAEFDAILAAQDGRCAICGTDAPNGHGWQVDHDHESGAVRGILCFGCNVGIGHLHDDPALLRAAAAYLERNALTPPERRRSFRRRRC